MATVAILAPLNNFVTIKYEYYVLDEVTGGGIDVNEDTGVTTDNSFVKDDQLLFQIKYEF